MSPRRQLIKKRRRLVKGNCGDRRRATKLAALLRRISDIPDIEDIYIGWLLKEVE